MLIRVQGEHINPLHIVRMIESQTNHELQVHYIHDPKYRTYYFKSADERKEFLQQVEKQLALIYSK